MSSERFRPSAIVIGIFVALAICIAAGLVLFGHREKPQQLEQLQSKQPEFSELVIGYSRLRISLPLFVAQENAIFEKHGIRAKLLVYDTAQPLMQALVEGKIEIGGYTAFPITFNGMLRSGKKLIFLTTLVEDQQHRLSYLLRKKAPVGKKPTINSIKALKGKKVGILPTIAYKAWLEAILKFNGVNPENVVIQQIEPTLQVQALDSGGVDALFTGDPAATVGIAKGIAEFITNEVEVPRVLGEPFPFGSFNVSKEWADRNPDLFKHLVAAINESVVYVNAHPAEAKQSMKPYMPDAFKAYVDIYPDARYLSTYESSEKTLLDDARRELEMGIIKEPIDLTGLVYVEGK